MCVCEFSASCAFFCLVYRFNSIEFNAFEALMQPVSQFRHLYIEFCPMEKSFDLQRVYIYFCYSSWWSFECVWFSSIPFHEFKPFSFSSWKLCEMMNVCWLKWPCKNRIGMFRMSDIELFVGFWSILLMYFVWARIDWNWNVVSHHSPHF